MAECSEHFLNGLATIAAVNLQLLQPNLVIMRRPLFTSAWKVKKLNIACALRHYALFPFTLYP